MASNRIDQLTNRQRQVYDRLLQGWSNQQIATDLGLSARTIPNHIYALIDKLGVSSSQEIERQRAVAIPVRLPRQQRRIVELRVLGYSVREVAKIMDIEYSTVRSHLCAIYEKLGVSSKSELIQLCTPTKKESSL